MSTSGKPAVELVIEPRSRDLGGFSVRRILPYARRRMVGPFIFLDEFGPMVMPAGQGLDVRPHPHIGLSTVTYLFDGEIMHRDSLGIVQAIRPGAANWMTAGRGIVHSERSGEAERAREDASLHGMQSWVALPMAQEETEPGFSHFAVEELPVIEGEGLWMRLIAGRAFGQASPVPVFSELFYLHAELQPGAATVLPAELGERAVYVVAGSVSLEGQRLGPAAMAVLAPGAAVRLTAEDASRVMLLGGQPLEGPRQVWWNFVASSPARLERAKAEWKAGGFDRVPGDDEFIPLPED